MNRKKLNRLSLVKYRGTSMLECLLALAMFIVLLSIFLKFVNLSSTFLLNAFNFLVDSL